MTTFQTPKQYMEQEKHCKNHRKRWTHSRCVGEKWWKHTRGKTSGGLFRLWGRYYPRICGPGFSEPHPYFSERPTAWHWIPSKINVLQLFSITRLHNFGGLGMHHTGAWYLGGIPRMHHDKYWFYLENSQSNHHLHWNRARWSNWAAPLSLANYPFYPPTSPRGSSEDDSYVTAQALPVGIH